MKTEVQSSEIKILLISKNTQHECFRYTCDNRSDIWFDYFDNQVFRSLA